MTNLTTEQVNEVEFLMEKWGAWVYSGRLEKREVSMLGHLIAKANPQKYKDRPMCDDDTGMLISEIMKKIKMESDADYEMLIQYYVYMMTKYQVAIRFHRKTKGSSDSPCLRTYQNIVDRALIKNRFFIYNQLKDNKFKKII